MKDIIILIEIIIFIIVIVLLGLLIISLFLGSINCNKCNGSWINVNGEYSCVDEHFNKIEIYNKKNLCGIKN